MTITLRLVKGTELTYAELDGNFTDLDERLKAVEAGGVSVAPTNGYIPVKTNDGTPVEAVVPVMPVGEPPAEFLTAASLKTLNGESLVGEGDLTWLNSPITKADPTTPCLVKTSAVTVQIKAGTHIAVGTKLVKFVEDTDVTMPTLVAGTDYAVWVDDTGAAQASDSHTTPPVSGAVKIGGFHYAPGGNAPAQAGGNTTPAINEHTFWDLKFRPACPDPRGMTLVAGSFWADIYFLGVNHHIDGTSKLGVTIADGASPPKIPLAFGGNGTTAYATMNWWEANEILLSYNKRMPDYVEFSALAYGVTEGFATSAEQANTQLHSPTTSKWGVMQAAGVQWTFGLGDAGASGAAWTANTGGRGNTNLLPKIALFGGMISTSSGSRCSSWDNGPNTSGSVFTARGVCDHLVML